MAHDVERASTTGGLPVAPSLGPTLEAESVEREPRPVDARVLWMSAIAVVVAAGAALVAQILTRLIGLITNLSFFGRVSTEFSSPSGNQLGPWVIAVPVLGGLIVGVMARYGSQAIRGHGIPEAMEQVLTNKSRIPARITFLKPLSAAIAIGTGGPFGAEGPIIATGGALGSLAGQILRTTAAERKTLLAAGAAAGMTATFGSPVSAVLLAVELLLFEYRARSLVPVALASAAATGIRIAFVGGEPVFPMPDFASATAGALFAYVVLGALVGLASVAVTRIVYAIEDGFDHLPIHWMWWPAIGAVAVGVVGFISPHTLGVGYDNIEHLVSGSIAGQALLALCLWKFVSWSISLGSGTSGGTLAPLLTIGGGLGAVLGTAVQLAVPSLGIDLRVAALVGMASMFAGASRALLASVVFAFETTHQPSGLLPLLGGGTAGFLVSCLLMRNSIMTEKIVRRGVRVLSDYAVDFLDQLHVRDFGVRNVITLAAGDTVEKARAFVATPEAGRHQAFPVLDDGQRLVGMVTRRELLEAPASLPVRALVQRPPVAIYDDSSLREAANKMAREEVGRLPVVTRAQPLTVIGILTRSDLVSALRPRIEEHERAEQSLTFGRRIRPPRSATRRDGA